MREGPLIHARKIVHETVDGETIVIHLEKGSYYSLTGAGAEIWSLLETGGSVSQICSELARRHERVEGEIRSEVEPFIADLEREDLVEHSDATPNGLPIQSVNGAGWESPKLERYDDMRDFLLVDPIHEVDETGWPSPKASQ
jgi:hypothetical protein